MFGRRVNTDEMNEELRSHIEHGADDLECAGIASPRPSGMLGPLTTWFPAQRALSIDPLALLREE